MMTAPTTSILWFRRDLRLSDHPALLAAIDAASHVLPVFVLDPRLLENDTPRTRRLLASVASLSKDTRGALVIRRGDPVDVIPRLAKEVGAPAGARLPRDDPLRPAPRRRPSRRPSPTTGASSSPPGTPYAVGPGRIVNQSGSPYKVFTPFSKAWHQHGRPAPASPPQAHPVAARRRAQRRPPRGREGLEARGRRGRRAEAVGELPPRRAHGIRQGTRPTRPRHDLRLSAPLKYGEIHPRTMLADIAAHSAGRSQAASTYVTELIWREFYADVLWHRPGLGVARPAARAREAALRLRLRDRPARRRVARGAHRLPRSSTPACASSSRRAGCTTGSG